MVFARAASCPTCEIHAESTFRVEGLDCHEEVSLLERRFRHLDGIEAFTADVVGGRIRVQYDAARLTTSAIAGAVADTGMRAWLEHDEPRAASAPALPLRLAISGAALAGSLGATLAGWTPAAVMLALAAIATGGTTSARRAWAALRLRTFDMHVLMSIAVIGAMAIGEWLEGATVVFLFALAQHLEARSLTRARTAIRALMDLTPPEVIVLRNGEEQRVAADSVRPGERIRIRPGDKLPLDGRVVAGRSEINQAPITGESMPVEKGPGDEVFAGTINGHGALEVEVTRHRRDTTLARIVHLVEEAQAKRAPSQAFVDRFARVYTPAVIALAAAIAVVPPLAGWGAAGEWVYRALVLLVIACPCALVIATPVAVVSALAAGARQGVLVKGGLHLERLAGVRAIAFDKTGTLTAGTPTIVHVAGENGYAPDQVLTLAASVNRHSEHPVGRVIAHEAAARGLVMQPVSDFRAVPGHGVEAVLDGTRVLVGSARFLESEGIPVDGGRNGAEPSAGTTMTWVAAGGRLVGHVDLADVPRDAARDAVDLLRRHDIRHITMLTGDRREVAERIGQAVGVDSIEADLLPQDKVAAVQRLRERWGSVAMVGDGINDAPALATADVGIVMGAVGSDAALETADVALMGDELAKLPYVLRLSRAAARTIRVNIAAALLVKAAFLALAVSGHTSLWLAILADMGTSLVVIANGLRLLRTT